MLKLFLKFGESNWNPYWVIMLTSSSGTNYVPNEHEDVDQYGSFTMTQTPDIFPWWTQHETILNTPDFLYIAPRVWGRQWHT